MRALRRAAATAAAITLTFTLVACTDSSETPSPDKATGGASAAASDDPAPAAELTKDNFIDLVKASAEDGTSYRAVVTSTVNGTTQAQNLESEIVDGQPRVHLTSDAEGLSMEAIFVDGKFYMNLGPLTDDKFTVLDTSDSTNPLASSFSSITEAGSPTKAIESLRDQMIDVKKAGAPEKVAGTTATPYTVTVDSAKMLAALGDLGSDAADIANLPPTLEITYWISADNRPVKTSTTVGGVTTETVYSDWGKKFDIKAPSADQITDKDPFSMAG